MSHMIALAAALTAVICHWVVPVETQTPVNTWTISNFTASYLYDVNQTASTTRLGSIDFLLNPEPFTSPEQIPCSLSLPGSSVFLLPAVTSAACGSSGGGGGGNYSFRLVLHPPGLGADHARAGAELSVLGGRGSGEDALVLGGSKFLDIGEFDQKSYDDVDGTDGEDDGRVDIEYCGPREFSLDVYEV